MTPNSSIHILAKSDENMPANSQHTVPGDWVDLKGKPNPSTKVAHKEKQTKIPADAVQHEVAALKMSQGLLKGKP